jgi:hypothetical protein
VPAVDTRIRVSAVGQTLERLQSLMLKRSEKELRVSLWARRKVDGRGAGKRRKGFWRGGESS